MSDQNDPQNPNASTDEAIVPTEVTSGEVDATAGSLDLGALFGGGDESGGGLDLGALLSQASQMQNQMAEAQQQLAEEIVEGVAGGGAVRVIVTGGMEFQAITIQPEAVDPDDVAMLQDLVLAALNDAMANVAELQSGAMGGLDLGSMGGLLG